VTNPPIDPLREGLVMSLEMRLGKRGNLLAPDTYKQVWLSVRCVPAGTASPAKLSVSQSGVLLQPASPSCQLVCQKSASPRLEGAANPPLA
jgi:Glutamate synthase central domain